MAYLASIHRASGVRHAVKANFLSADEPSLIVAKANRAEIYTFSTSGLTLRTTFTVYGTITGFLTLRPADSPTDHLFITTDLNDYLTVSWDSERNTIRNERKAQDVADRFLRDAPGGPKYLSDPGGRMLGIHVYEGLFLAIPFIEEPKKGRRKTASHSEIGNLGEHSPIRMSELLVVDLAFLYGTDEPVLAVLHRDGKPNTAQLSTYKIVKSGGEYKLEAWDIKFTNLEAEAKLLIPIPESLGGALVVGEQTVVYVPAPRLGEDDQAQAIKIPLKEPTSFQSWGMVDRQRYLLGDETGALKLLFLEVNGNDNVVDIKVTTIGKTSTANELIYLDNGHVFVGSQTGDSQLVKLSSEYPQCRVVQSFTSLAPICDFQAVSAAHSGPEDQQNRYSSGQVRIVSGCGSFATGGLRSIRSGVGLKDSAILGDMDGVKGIWALKSDPTSKFDDTVVVSLIGETRIFHFDKEGEVEELEEFKGFSLDEETLIATTLPGERLLQITPFRVKVIDAEGGAIISEVTTASKIIAAATTNDNVVCNVGNKSLVVYSIAGELQELKSRVFDNEIACLYASSDFPGVCAVGFWTVAAISLLSLPGLETLAEETLGGGGNIAIPRSIMMAQVLPNQDPSLLVAMGDGTLYTFAMNPHRKYTLSHKKAITLETQAFYFQTIPRGDGIVSVFAACDHPNLVYSDDGRLAYSAVTAENVTHLSPFNAEAFPSSVVVLENGELKISTIDTSRNIHFKSLPIGDVVRRVAYSKSREIYGIVTIHQDINALTGEERFSCSVRVVDDAEFAIIDTFALRELELVESIVCATLDNGDGTSSDKFIVGTGIQPSPDNPEDGDLECKAGRLLVFEFSEDRKLKLAAEKNVNGALKALEMVDDKIVAALNKTVEIYSYTYPTTPTKPELTPLASYRCHSEPIDLSVSGHTIAVADLMKGPYLLTFNPSPPTLTESARTYQTLWSTSVSLLSSDTVLHADAERNLTLWTHDRSGLTAADRHRLSPLSSFRLGELVNRIRRIPLTNVSPQTVIQPAAYIATVEGSIYLFGLISKEKTELLLRLQTNLAKVLVGVGEIAFLRWRAFSTPTRTEEEPERFVDGDFIEKFLELEEEEAGKVVEGLGVGVEEIRGLLEGLRTFH